MNTHTDPTSSISAWSLIADASLLVKLILLLLLGASILTWAIIFTKSKMLMQARKGNQEFLTLFWNANALDDIHQHIGTLPHSPVAQVFNAGYKELRKLPAQDRTPEGIPEISNIERALNRAHALEVDQLERYVEWLATTASAAPFVGLFGTVWGIMNSFQNIGATGSASLAVVAPGISEALIATAIGLAAAIPAVVAYNSILNRIKKISLETDSFSQEFLNMIQRSLLTTHPVQPPKKGGPHGHESEAK